MTDNYWRVYNGFDTVDPDKDFKKCSSIFLISKFFRTSLLLQSMSHQRSYINLHIAKSWYVYEVHSFNLSQSC